MTDTSLRRVESRGGLRGLWGLTLAETRRWLPWRSVGLVAAGLAVMGGIYAIFRIAAAQTPGNSALGIFLFPFVALWAAVLTLTVAASAQGAVAGEIDDGTAAWLVGMPVGRPAFVVSKVLAAIPGLVVAIGGAGAVGFVLIHQAASVQFSDFSIDALFDATRTPVGRSGFVPPPGFGEYLGLLVRMVWFELFLVALLVLVGTFLRSRSAVLGIGLAIALGMLILGLLRAQDILGPNAVLDLIPAGLLAGALDVLMSESASLVVPLISTTVWIVLLTGLATMRFATKEL